VRVLVIEPHSDGLLDLALRAQAEGHQVRYFCRDYDPQRNPVGRGLVDRVPDWRPSMRWADLVLLGSNGYCAQEFDRWQADGVPIIGAGSRAAEWEHDRMAGMQAFRRAGIPVPPYRQVATLDDAIRHAMERDEGMAVKPNGSDVTDKTTSFVAKTAKEMVYRLSNWKRQGKRFPSGLILQDVVKGVEFAVGAWIGPDGFVAGWEENFEEKRLFAGGVGPNCGEAGTVLRIVRKSNLADKVLRPFEDQLHSLGYVGNVDVNCIVDDDGNPWPLEFTMRFGYPAINIELALHRSDPIEFLAAVAVGGKPSDRAYDTIAVGVVMALPPYPFGHEKTEEVVGVPVWGVTPGIEDALHACNLQCKDEQLATSGSYVLVATGTADTVVKARAQAHRVIDRLTIPASPFWRNDIGSRLRSELPKLQAHGYATRMVYA